MPRKKKRQPAERDWEPEAFLREAKDALEEHLRASGVPNGGVRTHVESHGAEDAPLLSNGLSVPAKVSRGARVTVTLNKEGRFVVFRSSLEEAIRDPEGFRKRTLLRAVMQLPGIDGNMPCCWLCLDEDGCRTDVFNCGHAVCRSCIKDTTSFPAKCGVCQKGATEVTRKLLRRLNWDASNAEAERKKDAVFSTRAAVGRAVDLIKSPTGHAMESLVRTSSATDLCHLFRELKLDMQDTVTNCLAEDAVARLASVAVARLLPGAPAAHDGLARAMRNFRGLEFVAPTLGLRPQQLVWAASKCELSAVCETVLAAPEEDRARTLSCMLTVLTLAHERWRPAVSCALLRHIRDHGSLKAEQCAAFLDCELFSTGATAAGPLRGVDDLSPVEKEALARRAAVCAQMMKTPAALFPSMRFWCINSLDNDDPVSFVYRGASYVYQDMRGWAGTVTEEAAFLTEAFTDSAIQRLRSRHGFGPGGPVYKNDLEESLREILRPANQDAFRRGVESWFSS